MQTSEQKEILELIMINRRSVENQQLIFLRSFDFNECIVDRLNKMAYVIRSLFKSSILLLLTMVWTFNQSNYFWITKLYV